MELTLQRTWHKNLYIIGRLYVNNTLLCNTLEPSRTRLPYPAIPEGRYEVKVQWSRKFSAHRPFLQDVPRRSGIMIHEGNSVKDTLGCILLGDNTMKGMVLNSRLRCRQLRDALSFALLRQEPIFITIKD